MANEIAYVVSTHLQQGGAVFPASDNLNPVPLRLTEKAITLVTEDVQETDCLERSPVTPVIVLNEDLTSHCTAQNTGPSTRDKRNRKKRACKVVSPDPCMHKKLKIDSHIDGFYTKFIWNKYFNPEEPDVSPTFVDIGDFSIPYDHFRTSFRPQADIGNEVMCVYGKMSNLEEKESTASSSKCRKYTFSPYLAGKLAVDPVSFDKKACVREIRKISSKVSLATVDLMHFPLLTPNHWVLACVNSLFSTMNFFDSAGITSEKRQGEIINNLASNLNIVFKELNIDSKNFESFKKSTPIDYPCQTMLHDCRLFVMLYIENWTGKYMEEFSNISILSYRMTRAFNMFHARFNKVKIAALEASKKRKNM